MKLTLAQLFDLQDQARGTNLAADARVRGLINITDEAVSLATGALAGASFEAEKQTTFRVLGSEIVSACVVSARVSLWGCLPEALATLRPALEAAATLHWVADSQQYGAFAHELSEGRFRLFTYKNALEALGSAVGDFARIHGDFSNLGSHLTASRLGTQAYELGGEPFDRLAFALDRDAVLAALVYTPAPLLQAIVAFFLGYSQEARLPPEEAALHPLMLRYRDLRTRLKGGGEAGAA